MNKIFTVVMIAVLLVCGCKAKPENNNNKPQPIVAPTVITNSVQDGSAPVLPPYVPWWVKEL